MMPLGTLFLALPLLAPQDATSDSTETPKTDPAAAAGATTADQEGKDAQEDKAEKPPMRGSGTSNPHDAAAGGRSKGEAGSGRSDQKGTPPGKDEQPATPPSPPRLRETEFVFSPAQVAQPTSGLTWEAEWYSIDSPEGAGADPALVALEQTGRKIYTSLATGRTILVRNLEDQESLFDAFAADEDRMGRFGEFITESDGSLLHDGEELIYLECEWQGRAATRRVLAIYGQVGADLLRAVWIVGEPGAGYAELLGEAKQALPRLMGPLGAQLADSYYSIVGQHALAFDLTMGGGAAGSLDAGSPILLKPVAEPRAGETKYIEGLSKVNPQFKNAVVQNWKDEENDVSLSFQIIGNDSGMGTSNPFVHWLGGQYQRFHRDDKVLGDFPMELIHDENTLTQVLSSEEVRAHYQRNKRAPDIGVILSVTLTRSPYANNVQTYWMSSTSEEPEYGYARMVGLRQYVRSRSEIITRSSVAILMLRGSQAEAIARTAAALNLRTQPLDEGGKLPQQAAENQ